MTQFLKKSNNKTCELDYYPTVLLKGSFDAHVQTILDIFNSSFEYGIFPENFKRADVTPLLKKPNVDHKLLSNYRPVSNLIPYLGKLLEKIAVNRLLEHIQKLNLGEKFQSAYNSHHFTESALLHVQHSKALDSNNGVMLAMIDLSPAFDTIDHSIFINLMNMEYAVEGTEKDWFVSYLKNRQFCVKVATCRSDPPIGLWSASRVRVGTSHP